MMLLLVYQCSKKYPRTKGSTHLLSVLVVKVMDLYFSYCYCYCKAFLIIIVLVINCSQKL